MSAAIAELGTGEPTMRIVCATSLAAVEVAHLLLRAKLVPAHNFSVEAVFDPGEAITFTIRIPFPDALLEQIAAVPDTQIVHLA
jgi:hypothetical protein